MSEKNKIVLAGAGLAAVVSCFVCAIHSCGQADKMKALTEQIGQLAQRVGELQQAADTGKLAEQVGQLAQRVGELQQAADTEKLAEQVRQLQDVLTPKPSGDADAAIKMAQEAEAKGQIEDAITYVFGAIRSAPKSMESYRYLVELGKKSSSIEDVERLLEILTVAACHVAPENVQDLKKLAAELENHLQGMDSPEPTEPVVEPPALTMPDEDVYGDAIKTLEDWLDTVSPDDKEAESETVTDVEKHLAFLRLMRELSSDLIAAEGMLDKLPAEADDKSILNSASAQAIAQHLKRADENMDRVLLSRIDDLEKESAAGKSIVSYASKLEKLGKRWVLWSEMCTLRADMKSLSETAERIEAEIQTNAGKYDAPRATKKGVYTTLLEGDVADLASRFAEVANRVTSEEGRALCHSFSIRLNHLMTECVTARSLRYQQWALKIIYKCHSVYANRSNWAKRKGKTESVILYDQLQYELVWVDPANLTPLVAEAYNMVMREMLGGVAEEYRTRCKLAMAAYSTQGDKSKRKIMPITAF